MTRGGPGISLLALLLVAVTLPVTASQASGINVMTDELTGAKLSESGKKKDFKKDELGKDHITPKVNKATATELKVLVNGSVVQELVQVKIPFRTHGNADNALITCMDNGTSRIAWATVIGSASDFEEPMEILEENEVYEAIVENLEDHGYEVNEESALVIKTYRVGASGEVAHSAFITVEAIKEDQIKEIVALVCLDEDRVIAVADGYWECMGTCLLGYAQDIGGVCYVVCWFCAMTLTPGTCAACIGCVGVFAAWCAIQCTIESLWPW